jgi:hypothetical protein
MHSIGLAPVELLVIVAIIFLISVTTLVPLAFFCLTLQKCLNRCTPQCRTIAPGQVWLLLIPFFNLVWQFIVVSRISSTLANEFRLRSMTKEPEPGKSLGLAFCILFVCGIVPFLGILAGIAGLICWILYWVKIANYSAEISMPATAASNVQ